MLWPEVEVKFRDLAKPFVGAKCDEIARVVRRLGALRDVRELGRRLRVKPDQHAGLGALSSAGAA